MKNSIFLYLFLLLSGISFSQTFSGKIKDKTGNALVGVNIYNTKNKSTVSSDLDGSFIIKANSGDNLTFSMIGFATINVRASVNMIVVLEEEAKSLSDVVVVGYGTKKVGSITGSISQIKSEDLLKNPAQSAIQSIQGKAAGINIVTNDEPGAAPTILIRGLGTILSSSNPLYVIDGVEANGINGLSSNDIASIDILKDASSLAIYGQKGSNGVILITTKKGKKGEIKVNMDTYMGRKFIQRTVKMADSYRYAYYNNVARGSSNFYNLNQPVNTNWLDEITTVGEVNNNSFSFSGGNETANYYLGASNYNEKGILTGSEYQRNNIISKNELKAFDEKVKITQFINISSVNGTSKPLSAFTSAYKQSPIMPVYNPNGRYAAPIINSLGYNDMTGIERYNNVSNPAADLYYSNNKYKNLTLFGSIGAEIKLLPNLKFNSNFGATFDWSKSFSYNANREIWLYQNPTNSEMDYPTPNRINSLTQNTSNSYEWNWDNYLTYKKKFGKNDFTFITGMSRTTTRNSEYLSATRYNVPEQDNYWYLNFSSNNATIDPNSVVSNAHSTPIVSLAYFGRVEYEYNDKYLLSASLRREGISNFQANKRWDNFPALSAGWIVSKEDFLSSNKIINFLKVRGGYGEVGNGKGTPSVNNVLFSSGNNYSFGNNPQINPGSIVPYQIDPNLTWEKMKEIDFGIDFRLLHNNLSGSVDIYNRKTDKIILPVEYPNVLSPGAVYVNAGEVTNKGAELTLNWKKEINKNWSYSIGGNISLNDNKLSKVYNSFFKNLIGGGLNNGVSTKLVKEGEALGSFYVYEVKGYDSDGRFILSTEKVNAGSYLPKYTYGLNIGVNYKRMDLTIFSYGVGGNKVYNGKKAQRFGGENIERATLDNFWLPSNTNASNPKPSNDVPQPSTYFVEDGSYFRINNITFGYTLPKIIKRIDKLRIYATALNPFIFTKYTGYSPEITGAALGGAGIELDAYPTNKTFLIGLNINL